MIPLYAVDDGRETTLWGAASPAEAVIEAAKRYERTQRDRAADIIEHATPRLLGTTKRRGHIATIAGTLTPAATLN